ncbi:hypothetical protein JCM10914_3884 [Paenibacillus sp. JCM 10914]|nr:hypothetical protein JCM10914_3884 [Paenibacillus sp. JCM 10914]
MIHIAFQTYKIGNEHAATALAFHTAALLLGLLRCFTGNQAERFGSAAHTRQQTRPVPGGTELPRWRW